MTSHDVLGAEPGVATFSASTHLRMRSRSLFVPHTGLPSASAELNSIHGSCTNSRRKRNCVLGTQMLTQAHVADETLMRADCVLLHCVRGFGVNVILQSLWRLHKSVNWLFRCTVFVATCTQYGFLWVRIVHVICHKISPFSVLTPVSTLLEFGVTHVFMHTFQCTQHGSTGSISSVCCVSIRLTKLLPLNCKL